MKVWSWGLVLLLLGHGAGPVAAHAPHGWAQEPPSSSSARDAMLSMPPPGSGASRGQGPVEGLDAYVQHAIDSWNVPGLSLVLVRGDSVSTRAYGVTEVGGGVPVTPETLFGIGSLTKAFTATLIAMLVDEDTLAWDDPVVRHVPELAMHDPYVTRHLTIRDILSHRTGLAGDDLMWVAGDQSPEELIRRLRFQRPAHGFRARFGYHNVMYLLAGEIAERVTGESWATLMEQRIFEPLGMHRSTPRLGELQRRADVALPHDEVGPGQLLGTVPRSDLPVDAPDTVRRTGWFDPVTAPGGAIAASAEEFASWLRFQLGEGALDGRRLIDADALLETRVPQTPIPAFSRNQTEPSVTHLGAYGMGWGLRDYRGHLMVSHLGSTTGWSAAVAMLPDRDLGVAVFVNITRGTGLADSIQRWILDRLLGAERRDWVTEALQRVQDRRTESRRVLKEAAESRSADSEASLPLDAYAGTYVDSLYPPARVTRRNGGLRLALGPALAGDLDHWESDTFRVTWDRPEFGANLVTFHVVADSRPERLETRILGRHGVWRRSREDPATTALTDESLVGLWELQAAETLAPDGTVTPYPTHESFLLFTPEHYTMNWVGGAEPVSSYEEPFRPTDAEALARYRTLLVNSGRYTAARGILEIDPVFALVPEFVGGSGTFEYSLSGDILELRWTEIYAADGTPDPLTAQGYSFRYRFIRID